MAHPPRTDRELTLPDADAYIRVRVPNGAGPDGSALVYLPDGTALVVDAHQLVHLDPGPNPPLN